MINNWTNHNSTTNTSAAVGLTAGAMYAIRIEYTEATGDATARLRWAYPGQSTQVIPESRLYPDALPTNQAPTVNAGNDQTITLPSTASLTGTATDDGLPSPPATLTTTWSTVSGPGTVTFSAPSALATTATFSVAGPYVLRLTASDGTLTTTDDVSITVNPVGNHAPTVNAGNDPDNHGAEYGEFDRDGHRRRIAQSASGADDNLVHGQRAGNGDLQCAGGTDDDGDVQRGGSLRPTPHGLRWDTDDDR